MPQLMPLMWLMSFLVSVVILFTLMDIYYYSENYVFNELEMENKMFMMSFKW